MLTNRFASGIACIVLSLGAIAALGGCDDDAPAPMDPSASEMAAIRLYTVAVPGPMARGGSGEGEVVVDRARLLLRRVVLKDASGREVDFTSSPRVVELALDGSVNELLLVTVPPRTYDEVRFDVHELDDDDPRHVALLQMPEFSDFGGDDRASSIVEGRVRVAGEFVPFVFRDDANDRQDVEMSPPLDVRDAGGVVGVTLRVDTSAWFRTDSGGWLDPRSDADAARISDNVRRSIDVFRDDDRDGRRD